MGDSGEENSRRPKKSRRSTVVSGDETYIPSDSDDDEDFKDAKEPNKRPGDSGKESRRPTIVYGHDPYALNPEDPLTRGKIKINDDNHRRWVRRREELKKEREKGRRQNPKKSKIKHKTPVFPDFSEKDFFGEKFNRIAEPNRTADYKKEFRDLKEIEKERKKNKDEYNKAYYRFLEEERKKRKEGTDYKNLNDALAEELIRTRVDMRMYERGIKMRIAKREAEERIKMQEANRKAEERKRRKQTRRSIALKQSGKNRTNLHYLKF